MPVILLQGTPRDAEPEPSTCVDSAPELDADTADVTAEPGELDRATERHPATAVEQTRDQRFVLAAREELDTYFVDLKRLKSWQPAEVFLWLSGVTARLVELRTICWRSESRRLTALRSREIDPLIDECERQFRFHSRVEATRRIEWDAMRGQV